MVRRALILVSLGFYLCFSVEVSAKDFGKYGVTREIKEEGVLAMIARKLKAVDMEKEQKKMQKLAKERIENPVPVQGVTKTTFPRSFTFDPTYVLREDIILPSGELLYPRGAKVNPLEYMDLNREMIFIDASDKSQEKWLKTKIEERRKKPDSKEEELVVILVRGSPLDLQEKIAMPVYFDQGGVITSKFGIKQVPATAIQEGMLLRIEEIYIGDRYE